MRKSVTFLAIIIPVMCLMGAFIYTLPVIQERLGWRMEALRADIKYLLDPPEQRVFVPGEQGTAIQPDPPSPTATLFPLPTTPSASPVPTNVPTLAPTSTLTPTPLPASASLSGILHQYQMWNNCGPANLSMALSFWDWRGDQRDTAEFLKPNQRDKNVMPYEMESYVDEQTDLLAFVRYGGDLDTIKAFLSAGFPVIAEKGFEGVGFDGWMGHYQVVTAYDEVERTFTVQDSYKGPDIPLSYDEFRDAWRAFNYTYIVIYPPDRQNQVFDILGLQVYDNFNHHYAAQKALDEIAVLTGRDLYFAWFNRGTNLVYLQDYTAAAAAYDTAFANYALIPEEQRPWRMMWYQTGPYFAYFYSGRYLDVINLATSTLDAMSEPILEESYYWRAKAERALGDDEAAVEDLQSCLEVHADFSPCMDELRLMGIEP